MYVIRRRGWEIPEHQATPEGVYLNRRDLLGAAAGVAAAALVPDVAGAQRVTDIPDPTKDLYPAKRNEKYGLDGRPVTPEEING
ncbi:MAG: methionine sulfoxide reductase catalytic subunit, partial [Hyphomicrobiales bacterium]